MSKTIKRLLAITLTTVISVGMFTLKQVKAAPSDDAVYFNAYTLTQTAVNSKTQAAINNARKQIEELPKSLDWAKPEFSKQLDIVENDVMNNAINAYYKALENAQPEDINKINQILDDIKTSEDASINSWADNLRGQVNYICYNHAVKEINDTIYALPNVYNSLKDNKRIKVAFWGDSITEGANNNLSDTYPQLFIKNIKNIMPDIDVQYTNFALGGRSTYNAVDGTYKANNPESPRNPLAGYIDFWRDWSIQGESWAQHIANYKPDLLFIAFGMNDAFDKTSLDYDYISNLITMINYVKTNSPTTDIVLVSNILPTENKALYNQSSEHSLQIARATREYAKTHDIPLVDANRLWSILLYGLDEDEFSSEEITGLNNIENTISYNSELQVSLNKYLPIDQGTEIALRTNDSEGGIELNFNETNGTNYVSVNVLDNGLDKPGYCIGSVKAQDVNNIKLDGSSITINGSTFIIYKHLINGAIIFPQGKENIGNIKLIKKNNLMQAPLYNELDMLGNVNGSTSGNGINHPTALGMYLSYYTACGSIINSIKAEYEKTKTEQK